MSQVPEETVHLLPFNTAFRGQTNIAEHFARNITAAKATDKLARQNEHGVELEDFMYSAVPESDNQIPAFGAVVPAAAAAAAAAMNNEKKNDDDDDDDDDETDKKKKKPAVANNINRGTQLSQFRGRKLVGKALDLSSEEASHKSKYIGVVAILPLATEGDMIPQQSDTKDGCATSESGAVASSSSATAAAAASATSKKAAAGGFSLDWKKGGKKKNSAAAGAATLDAGGKESGTRRHREDGEEEEGGGDTMRMTEPHSITVDTVGPSSSADLKNTNSRKASKKIDLGQISSARPLEIRGTFDSFVVWDHDRQNLGSLNPTLGIPLWFDVAEALHGQ